MGGLVVLPHFMDAAQHHLHACHDLAGTEGLGDVIVRTQLQSQEAVKFLRLGAEHDDRHVGFLANLAAHHQSVLFGHHDIQHNDVRARSAHHFEGLIAVVSREHLVLFPAEVDSQRLVHARVVVRHKHAVAAAFFLHAIASLSTIIPSAATH